MTGYTPFDCKLTKKAIIVDYVWLVPPGPVRPKATYEFVHNYELSHFEHNMHIKENLRHRVSKATALRAYLSQPMVGALPLTRRGWQRFLIPYT